MAMIRPAKQSDIIGIVDMVEALRAAVGGPVAVDRPHTAHIIAQLIASPDGAVWLSGGGFIAGSLQPTIINPAPVAMEHGWYASDGSGLRLLRTFERWARDRGALLVQISTGPDGLDLTRLGYRVAEQAWIK
ncbi:hypothetical protein [Paracoccus sp. JM45]|uniref:hypothetical protein n=1 Tax=Paracoccus sp. JM45 TaxID=2283626 RepID=UPI000EDBA914|nr:hypothetical protein [Paracoccus sp. JM45]RJE81272.1 hypothetical protein DWB67_01030 [Paracoccus sp. JM45]